MKRYLLLSLLVAAFGLAGCNTVEKRIEQKAAVFNALPPEQQKALREGKVEVGFTEDMAYIALGRPDEIKERTTADAVIKTWTYLAYTEDYEGQHTVGYRRQVFVDRRTNRAYISYRPVDVSVYSERVEELLRVEFVNGKVTALEQPEP